MESRRIQYNGSSTADTLSFIQTEEGKAVHNGTTYDYQYYLGDNLGNTRITFNTKKGIAYTVQQDDYYPFGLEILRAGPHDTKNEYLYNKKELQEDFTEYDYGARYYDPVLARWTSVDPMAETSRRFSAYNYVLNNPIRFIDPDGMKADSATIATIENRRAAEQLGFQSAKSESNFDGGNIDDPNVEPDQKQQTSKSDTSKSKGRSLSSKFETGVNVVAIGIVIGGGGPEEPVGDVIAAGEEVVGQVLTGLIKLGELAVDLYTTVNVVHNIPVSQSMTLAHKYAGLTGSQIIAKFKKGSIRQQFPQEYDDKPWEIIEKDAQKGVKQAQTARKLLMDNRFNK